MFIKRKMSFLIFLSLFSACSYAGNSLEQICSADKGNFIGNVHIQKYAVVTAWPQAGKNDPAAQIKVNEIWYGIYSAPYDVNGGGIYGIQQFASTMALLHAPVDICIKWGVLRGIQNAGSWPR